MKAAFGARKFPISAILPGPLSSLSMARDWWNGRPYALRLHSATVDMHSPGVKFLTLQRPILAGSTVLSAFFALLCPPASAQTTLCGRQPAIPVSDGLYNVQSNEFN